MEGKGVGGPGAHVRGRDWPAGGNGREGGKQGLRNSVGPSSVSPGPEGLPGGAAVGAL